MTRKPTTIDEYLAALSKEKRAALEKLRKTIRAAAPKAEECISYQLPAFRLNGMLVGFGAAANHCAFYLMSGSTVAAHADELEKYDTSKGTIRFQADKPLPAALVRKLVKARIAENSGAEHASSIEDQVQTALTWLKRHSTKRTRDGMARYGIPSDNALGVTVANIQVLGKRLGRNHELAAALWETGVYEARLLTAFVDDPARVTPAQMDRWCRDFDSWAVCDTVCFKLFDQTPHAWKMYPKWCVRREEFVRRAGFALLACLALHDKIAPDAPFLESLPIIERIAGDERNFVKKSVSWALRAVGRRNPTLHAASVVVARRLADSTNTSARWVGKDALRELTSPVVMRRVAVAKKPSKPLPDSAEVDEFMRRLDHPLKPALEAVRAIILGANPDIRESIKWKAPSFRTREYFATINVRKDVVLVILHLGAKVRDNSTAGLDIEDPAGLIEWLAQDRGAVTFRDLKAVKASSVAFQAIVHQWITRLA